MSDGPTDRAGGRVGQGKGRAKHGRARQGRVRLGTTWAGKQDRQAGAGLDGPNASTYSGASCGRQVTLLTVQWCAGLAGWQVPLRRFPKAPALFPPSHYHLRNGNAVLVGFHFLSRQKKITIVEILEGVARASR